MMAVAKTAPWALCVRGKINSEYTALNGECSSPEKKGFLTIINLSKFQKLIGGSRT